MKSASCYIILHNFIVHNFDNTAFLVLTTFKCLRSTRSKYKHAKLAGLNCQNSGYRRHVSVFNFLVNLLNREQNFFLAPKSLPHFFFIYYCFVFDLEPVKNTLFLFIDWQDFHQSLKHR